MHQGASHTKTALNWLKMRLVSQGSICFVLARGGSATTFLFVLGVSVDQLARHLGHWKNLVDVQWEGIATLRQNAKNVLNAHSASKCARPNA